MLLPAFRSVLHHSWDALITEEKALRRTIKTDSAELHLKTKTTIEGLSDDDVLELINYHNNTDDNALDGRVKKLFLPIIKNDLKICQECKLNYEYCNISSLIFYGLEDTFTNIDEVEKWNRYVKCDSIIGLPGKHFYFQQKENQRIIFEQINKFIENWNGR